MTLNEAARETVRLLREKGLFIVVMESCTGGRMTDTLTNVVGASTVLRESYVTYSNDAKVAQGVDPKVIENYGVYSFDCAMAMAETAMLSVLADKERTVGVGITGRLSRLDPANPGGTTGEVFIAVRIWDRGSKVVRVVVDEEDRSLAKAAVVHKALTLVLLPYLKGERG